jgi:hypothetical protein
MKPPKGVTVVGLDRAEFSVCQFFVDGSYECVCQCATAERAFEIFKNYTLSVGARLGTTVRVIITDGDDYTNAEWKFGEGLTYPKPEDIGK